MTDSFDDPVLERATRSCLPQNSAVSLLCDLRLCPIYCCLHHTVDCRTAWDWNGLAMYDKPCGTKVPGAPVLTPGQTFQYVLNSKHLDKDCPDGHQWIQVYDGTQNYAWTYLSKDDSVIHCAKCMASGLPATTVVIIATSCWRGCPKFYPWRQLGERTSLTQHSAVLHSLFAP